MWELFFRFSRLTAVAEEAGGEPAGGRKRSCGDGGTPSETNRKRRALPPPAPPRATCEPCASPTLVRAELLLRFERTRELARGEPHPARPRERPKVSPRTSDALINLSELSSAPRRSGVRTGLCAPVPASSCKFLLRRTERTSRISSIGVCVAGNVRVALQKCPKSSAMADNGHFWRWVRISTTTGCSISKQGCFAAVIQRQGVLLQGC